MTKILALCVLAFGFVLASPSTAHARGKGFFLFNTGQHAFECGPLPAPFDKEPKLTGWKAGYICDITGVFWSYFSVRNCKPAAINGSSYADDPELVTAIKAKYPESSMQRGIWNRFGWIIFAVMILGGVLVTIRGWIKGED